MEPEKPGKPCIFIDADVLFAGAASPNQHSASSLILRMAELTLIEAITSVQVITEVERNLVEKMPKAIPAFRMLVSRSLKVIPDPGIDDLAKAAGLADQEDLPILIAAVQAKCGLLVTFNMRHFLPGHPEVTVLKPGDIVLRIRYLLARLSDRS
jgi:predicted nucleic acid-binding protein